MADIMKKKTPLTVGLVAHVDAGKTTLSEAILYISGAIKKQGRVDKQDAFLDNFYLERQRGITIFSKQAKLSYKNLDISLLDTPGHVDFSGEMERVLSVLDIAILIINAADGVQSHTKTLWRLLEEYKIPTIVFVNKMDRDILLDGQVSMADDMDSIHQAFIKNLSSELASDFVDFTKDFGEDFLENVASTDEAAMDLYLNGESIGIELIAELINTKKITPVYFGSALKLEGVEVLLSALEKYSISPDYPEEFGARVFKITRDDSGNRLTHMKLLGGRLKAKDLLTGSIAVENASEDISSVEEVRWSEKVNQIRFYSGEKYEAVQEVSAGDVCAVTGLTSTYPGQGLGSVADLENRHLEPVLTYRVFLPKGVAPVQALPFFKELEEEDPLLNVVWNEELQELSVRVMGDVQVEILKELIKNRFDLDVDFGNGNIIYKETIANVVEGVGHFEPLRHYAEVHVLMEPLPAGSGLVYASDCSEEILAKNWQRLVLTHLAERKHRGVLTGSVITDMKITLVAGRAHLKHTEGGDFRQATYRAVRQATYRSVRQGLMEAESVLLEPYYSFAITLPATDLGRAMTDIDAMKGVIEPPETNGEQAILRGKAPVSLMMDYQKEIYAYTKGEGRIELNLFGYLPCHNATEVIEKRGYDPEVDFRNPTGSVFCEHGAGTYIPWDEVKSRMHVDSVLSPVKKSQAETVKPSRSVSDIWIDVEEVDSIIHNASNANKKKDFTSHKGITRKNEGHKREATVGLSKPRKVEKKDKYLLVDGYNVIFAWPDLKELAASSIEGARGKLADILVNYRGALGINLILVFDAYRIQGHKTEVFDYNGIHVVYTKEAETADQFIEKFAHENGKKYDVTVATSDGLEQIIIRGAGCGLISAREFHEEIERVNQSLRENFLSE